MMKKILAFLLLALPLAACSTLEAGPVGNTAVPQPAKAVDLDRYLGRWYELARYEAGFQKGCEGVTADYSLSGPGQIKVLNSCRKNGLGGKLTSATGKAKSSKDRAMLNCVFPFLAHFMAIIGYSTGLMTIAGRSLESRAGAICGCCIASQNRARLRLMR